ncbi:hydrogenase assembly protein HupF, partial [Rhodospirillum rubrum]
EGVGMVEAARGLLIHRVVVREGRVARWRILAPTEWNLHPQGALASLLIGCPVSGTEEACLLAHWLVLALDPCVPCVITAIGEGADA